MEHKSALSYNFKAVIVSSFSLASLILINVCSLLFKFMKKNIDRGSIIDTNANIQIKNVIQQPLSLSQQNLKSNQFNSLEIIKTQNIQSQTNLLRNESYTSSNFCSVSSVGTKKAKISLQQKKRQKNQQIYKIKIQQLIFSIQRSPQINHGFQGIVVPNPQCLGCIQFFYKQIAYNFSLPCQVYEIITTSTIYTHKYLSRCLLSYINNSMEAYIFISQKIERNGAIYLQGLCPKFSPSDVYHYVLQIIRDLVYNVGQKYLSIKDFQISLLPIIQGNLIVNFDEQKMKLQSNQNCVIRIKYNPYKRIFSPSQQIDNMYSQSNFSNRHRSVNCQKPISVIIHPEQRRKKIEIFEIFTNQDQNYYHDFKYRKATILKINSKFSSQLIDELHKIITLSNLTYKIFKPFQEHRRKKNIVQNLWSISHDCSHEILLKIIGKINKPGNIIVLKAYKNLKVSDENFFTNKIFQNFQRQYESLTNTSYNIFNVEKGMRLYKQLKRPIYITFPDYRFAILALCILEDLRVKSVIFVSREMCTESPNSDSQNYNQRLAINEKSKSEP